MSRAGSLRPGPSHKTPAWRGGALALGAIGMLWIAELVTSGVVSLLGLGSTALLLVLGIALSIPYGRAWLSGVPPAPKPSGELAPLREVPGEPGATYIVVGDGRRRGGVRAKELTPGWFVLYTLFWRAPMALGDYALVGLWTLLGQAMGRNGAPRRGDAQEADELPDPGRVEF